MWAGLTATADASWFVVLGVPLPGQPAHRQIARYACWPRSRCAAVVLSRLSAFRASPRIVGSLMRPSLSIAGRLTGMRTHAAAITSACAYPRTLPSDSCASAAPVELADTLIQATGLW
jgi:hypothetical protein